MFYHCASQSHRNSTASLALIQPITFLIPEKKIGKSQIFFSLSNPSGQMMLSQEISWATLRLLRAAPYYPWGKETGNPTADIQSIGSIFKIHPESDRLTPPPLLQPWIKPLLPSV